MQITIDGKKVKVNDGETILSVATRLGIEIPTLCFHPDLKPEGRCRICLVEADGKLITSCDNKVREGMIILTNTNRVVNSRKLNAELLYSGASFESDIEIAKLFKDLGIEESRFTGRELPCRKGTPLERENKKCVLCGRCVQVCREIQNVQNIDFAHRGMCTEVTTPYHLPMIESPCTFCGQCALYCPTTALRERALSEKLVHALGEMSEMIKNRKFFVVQTAPAVRASLGELFGLPPGTLVTGKMVAALRKMGFDKVFDTDFGADLTIMEEANEFLERLKTGKDLPLITSCCPAWIMFAEQHYPQVLKHISSCKSPQQMFGAIAKNYYARLLRKDPKDIFVVSVMPCVAKKFEAQRPEMRSAGRTDVDLVLTTRELARMLKEKNINLTKLKNEKFDEPLGVSTGGAAIFGVTGGVMEAALRVAYEEITGKQLKKVDFNEVRGIEGLREAEIVIGKQKVKVAIIHSLSNAKELIESGQWKKYHFIEVMACPGGCIGGGGQPRPTTNELRKKRIGALYKADKNLPIRISSHSPAIKQIYSDFLDRPLSRKAEKLLHTKYRKRKPRYF